jgi:hypothetical protein
MIRTRSFKRSEHLPASCFIVLALSFGMIIGPGASIGSGAITTQNQSPPSLTVIAGTRVAGFSDGPGGENGTATFNLPRGIRYDANENLYVADTGNHAIRKIDTNGNVTTVAGIGSAGFADGTGGRKGTASFNAPEALTVDNIGNVYVADTGNHAIRKIDTNGNVTTIAGNGKPGTVDGNKTTSPRPPLFDSPKSIDIDNGQTLYVTSAGRIRKIDPDGNVTTVETKLDDNFLIALNRLGEPYVITGRSIYDGERYLVNNIDPNGSTINSWDFRPPADPQGARYNLPRPFLNLALAFDASGNVFTTSAYGFRKVTPSGDRFDVNFDLVKSYARNGSLQWSFAIAVKEADSLALTVGSSIVRLDNPSLKRIQPPAAATAIPSVPAASIASTTVPGPKPKLCEAFAKMRKAMNQVGPEGSEISLQQQSKLYRTLGAIAKQYENAAPADIGSDWKFDARSWMNVAAAYTKYFKLSKATRAATKNTFTNGLFDFGADERHARVVDWANKTCGIHFEA